MTYIESIIDIELLSFLSLYICLSTIIYVLRHNIVYLRLRRRKKGRFQQQHNRFIDFIFIKPNRKRNEKEEREEEKNIYIFIRCFFRTVDLKD